MEEVETVSIPKDLFEDLLDYFQTATSSISNEELGSLIARDRPILRRLLASVADTDSEVV